MPNVIFATRERKDDKGYAYRLALPDDWTIQTAEQILAQYPDPWYEDLARAGGAVRSDGARMWVVLDQPHDPNYLFTTYREVARRTERTQIAAPREAAVGYAVRLVYNNNFARDPLKDTVEYVLADYRDGRGVYVEFAFASKPTREQIAACDAIVATASRMWNWPEHSDWGKPVVLRQPKIS